MPGSLFAWRRKVSRNENLAFSWGGDSESIRHNRNLAVGREDYNNVSDCQHLIEARCVGRVNGLLSNRRLECFHSS